MQSNVDQHQPDEATTSVLQGCMVKANEMMILMKKFDDGLPLGETQTTLILARQHLSE